MGTNVSAALEDDRRSAANRSATPSIAEIIRRYLHFMPAYWREAKSGGDFLRLMQVRLSKSKIGKLVCPRQVTAEIRLRSFGDQPLHLRSHTTDNSVLEEIIVSGGYDALLRNRPEKVEHVIDLGANTGLVDRWLLERFPGAEIVAVEPEPGNAAALRRNISGLPVQVVEAAIGATHRMVRLHTETGEHGFTFVGEPQPGSVSCEVPVVVLDEVSPGGHEIDLLKVDIEGAEEELFADCAGWIGRVRTLLVECHGNYKLANLMSDLRRNGGEFRLIEADAKPDWGFEVGLLVRN